MKKKSKMVTKTTLAKRRAKALRLPFIDMPLTKTCRGRIFFFNSDKCNECTIITECINQSLFKEG